MTLTKQRHRLLYLNGRKYDFAYTVVLYVQISSMTSDRSDVELAYFIRIVILLTIQSACLMPMQKCHPQMIISYIPVACIHVTIKTGPAHDSSLISISLNDYPSSIMTEPEHAGNGIRQQQILLEHL